MKPKKRRRFSRPKSVFRLFPAYHFLCVRATSLFGLEKKKNVGFGFCERASVKGFQVFYVLLRLRADQREGKQERDEKALCEKKVEETDDDDGLVGITQR